LDGDFVRPGGAVGLPCRGVVVGVTTGSVGVGVLVGVDVGLEVGVGVGSTVGEDDGSVRTATGVTSSAGLVDSSSEVSAFGRSSLSAGVSRGLGTGVGVTFGR
jgi:hypothetical protein